MQWSWQCLQSTQGAGLTSLWRPRGDLDPVMCLRSVQRSGPKPETHAQAVPALPCLYYYMNSRTYVMQNCVTPYTHTEHTLNISTFGWLQLILTPTLIQGLILHQQHW